MGKQLVGTELAAFIKERQARQVRMLRQAHGIVPKLVIIKSIHASEVINTYVRMKPRYAADILVETEVMSVAVSDMPQAIERANADTSVQAIIVQLPLDDPQRTDEIVSQIAPEKDVDGLGSERVFVSATAEAIDWLLAGYNVSLGSKRIALLGNGRLVGAPLARMWRARGFDVTVYDSETPYTTEELRRYEVIVTATGNPRLLSSADIAPGTVVVDAGTTSEDGVIVGDLEPDVYERRDIDVTPARGGVGPLTVALMFDHVIRACLATIESR